MTDDLFGAMWPDGEFDNDLEAPSSANSTIISNRPGRCNGAPCPRCRMRLGRLLRRCMERNPNLEAAVGLTLSAEQARYCLDSLPWPAIECRLENWRDHQAMAPYDSYHFDRCF